MRLQEAQGKTTGRQKERSGQRSEQLPVLERVLSLHSSDLEGLDKYFRLYVETQEGPCAGINPFLKALGLFLGTMTKQEMTRLTKKKTKSLTSS